MTVDEQRAIQVADAYFSMWRSLRRDAFLARVAGKDAGDIKAIEDAATIAHSAALAEQRRSEPTYHVGER